MRPAHLTVRGREQQHPLLLHFGIALIQQGLQVVQEVIGLLLVAGDEQLALVRILHR